MRASRILPLARTRRCAIVGSGTRNARAISAVVSPPSRRRVSATWAELPSAGWQQVKISRSRSSWHSFGRWCLGGCWRRWPASFGGAAPGQPATGADSRMAWTCLSCPGGSRRSVVDALVSRGRDQPARRTRRQPVARPALQRRREGILDRVFGDVDVAEDADQYRYRPAVFLPVDLLNLRRRLPSGLGRLSGLDCRHAGAAPPSAVR